MRASARFKVTWPNGKTNSFGVNCATSDFGDAVTTSDIVLFSPTFGRTTCTARGRELVLSPVGNSPWLPLRAGQTYVAEVRQVRTDGNTFLRPNTMVLSVSQKADATVPQVLPGHTVRLSTAFDRDMSHVVTAVGGDPVVLAGGKLSYGPEHSRGARHPRTAVGFSATHIFLVVVDGRQQKLSIGMNFHELGRFMSTLGCTDALNLDGGGSTTMWVKGKVVNSPSDGKLRAVGNSLMLFRQPLAKD